MLREEEWSGDNPPEKVAGARLWLPLFLFCFAGVLGWGWLGKTPSFEEMLGGTARGWDYFVALSGGSPWWTPNYLMGHSLSFFTVSILPVLLIHALAWALPFLGVYLASKVFGLAAIVLGGLASGALARRLAFGETGIFFAGALYAMSGQFVLRVAQLEHLTTAACMVFAPLILLGLARCRSEGGWRAAALLGMSVAGMGLCYLKILLLFLPAGAVFFCWLWAGATKREKISLGIGCARGALLCLPLLAFPMIPVLRESRYAAFFELDPFPAWQNGYSFFTPLSFVDWGNLFTAGTAIPVLQPVRHAVVEYYIGPAALAGIAVPLILAAGRSLPEGGEIRIVKLFAGLFLLCEWLASGPRTIWQSQILFSDASPDLNPLFLVISWALFLAQIWVIFQICGRGVKGKCFAMAAAFLFLFAPGFRILEKIPFYGDIRAPGAVWTAFGALSAAMAAAAGWEILFRRAGERGKFVPVASVLAGLLVLDAIFLHRAFFRDGLPRKLFDDYADAQAFLRNAPLPGRVQALSGRYFYLTTPRDSGRPLVSEALLRHIQSIRLRYMEAGALSAPEAARAFADVCGIAYFLLDKNDPDTPRDTQLYMSSIYPKVFENENFCVLANGGSLYPGFAAWSIVPGEPGSFKSPAEILKMAGLGYVVAEGWKPEQKDPGLPRPLERLDGSGAPGCAGLALDLPPGSSPPPLIVASMAYHPDWTASQNGRPLDVLPAVGGLLGAIPQAGGTIDFEFRAPLYYSVFLVASLVSWAVVLLSFPLVRLFRAGRVRTFWFGMGSGTSLSHGDNPVQ